MADHTLEPCRSFDDVWNEELDALAKLRAARGVEAPAFAGDTASERAYAGQATGLTFSGGGIRSATFNLGVAQALAKYGLLRRMDYLSTISGGGYIGSWLTAWIRNQGFQAVEARLPVEHTKTEQPEGRELHDSPVTFLRAFSNYLIPRLGALSADTWAVIATYVRNLLLNLLVLISALSAFLLLPRVLVQVSGWIHGALGDQVMLALGLGFLVVAICGMGANVISIELHQEGEHPWYADQKWVQLLVAIPLFLSCWLIACAFWFANVGAAEGGVPVYLWMAANAFVYLAIWALVWAVLRLGKRRAIQLRSHWGWLLGTAPFAGAVGGLLAWLAVRIFVWGRSTYFPAELEQSWSLIHATVLGAPGIALVFILTAVLHIGLMGRSFDEANREWWSRLGGWLMIYGISWFAFNAFAFYAPVAVIWLNDVAAAALGAGWLGISIGGLLFERKTTSATDGPEKEPSKISGLVRALTPQIFVIGLLAFLASGLHAALDSQHTGEQLARVERGQKGSNVRPQPAIEDTCDDFWRDSTATEGGKVQLKEQLSTLMRCHSARTWVTLVAGRDAELEDLSPKAQPTCWLVPVVLLVLGLGSIVLSARIDINQFSMHLFYRNRLIRAYLGASNPKRHPQAFTGFDPADDFPLAELHPDHGYDGPYQLLGINLNLVKGEELAWQQRKGASFLFSPLYTGWAGAVDHTDRAGYRPTKDYDMPGGISLGMAMAISGAAVTPSMGQGTTAAMSFLLTVFDARLGWWLGNPADAKSWPRVGPDVGLFRLLAELFGSTDDRSKFVYLSDGGHFENMGMYELVRRRCRFIIACDGGADLDRTFGGLANAIRKCRTDFGVPISIDLDGFEFGDTEVDSKVHCAVGTIHYDAVDPGKPKGTLLFLKTTITGDEPTDVLNYRAANPAFPNQSTADQFFDESQFESYRTLGYHTVEKVFENLAGGMPDQLGHEELCEVLVDAYCSKKTQSYTGGGG